MSKSSLAYCGLMFLNQAEHTNCIKATLNVMLQTLPLPWGPLRLGVFPLLLEPQGLTPDSAH